jgi:hypothetical protein
VESRARAFAFGGGILPQFHAALQKHRMRRIDARRGPGPVSSAAGTEIPMTNLLRLLLIGAAIWFGLRLYRQWKLNQAQNSSVDRQRTPEAFEPMVRCRSCGVHLPASAVSSTGLCGKCNS